MTALPRIVNSLMLVATVLAAAEARALDLTGRWLTETFATNMQVGRVEHVFGSVSDGARATMTLDMHSALPYQSRSVQLIRTGRYRIVGPSTRVPGGYEVDIEIERITAKMRDPDSVWLANRDGGDFCALRDWQVGVERDISGKRCDSYQMAQRGDVEKIVAVIDGTTLKLSPYWGTGAVEPAARTTAVRAESLDETHVFKKSLTH